MIESKLAFLLASLKRASGLSFSVGVSESASPKEEGFSYRKLFRHTKWALGFRAIMGDELVLFYDDLALQQKNFGKVDENDFKDISYAVLYGKEEEAKEMVDRLLDNVFSLRFKDSYLLVLNTLLDALLKSCIALDQLYGQYKTHMDLISELYAKKGKEGTVYSSLTSSPRLSRSIAASVASESMGLLPAWFNTSNPITKILP